MAKSHQDIVPIEQVRIFYRVAYTSLLRVERLAKDRVRHERAFVKDHGDLTADDLDFLSLNGLTAADEERLAIVAVIFSAFTLEALINDYLISNVSKSYLENYLDRLTPVSKWLTFPQLVAGKRMSTDGQTFQRLVELFHLRNDLAHFKSGDTASPKHIVTREEAQRAIDAVRLATAQLKKLDRRVSTLWLPDTETDAKRALNA